jgi:hypothetical protein
MSFAEQIAQFAAAQIIAATGCPRGTAYAWLDGTRQPPEWQRRHWVAIIKKATKKA